jgi:hypothetical protein
VVEVLVFDGATDDALQPRQTQRLFQTVRAEGSLISMTTVLDIFIKSKLGEDALRDNNLTPIFSTRAINDISFVAADDVELYTVSIADWMKLLSEQPHSALHILQEIIHRLYFVTLPICRSYFGLDG